MTEANRILRDQLQSVERIVTAALASQPHGDEECGEHLRKAVSDICNVVSRASRCESAALRDGLVQLRDHELAFCESNVEKGIGLSAFGLEQHCKIIRGIIELALSSPSETNGNVAALRNALKLCMKAMCYYCLEGARALGLKTNCENGCETLRIAKEALSLPPRQCDVGTPEEQESRYERFCDSHKWVDDEGVNACSFDCPLYNASECALRWAQTPYEEQEGDEIFCSEECAEKYRADNEEEEDKEDGE